MSTKLVITSALAAIIGFSALPASANSISIEQWGWSNTIGGSQDGRRNAIGIFHPFLEYDTVRLIGVEAGGRGIEGGEHAARFADPKLGRLGVLQGTKSYVMQDDDGQIALTHSISAGLDYASVGPEHAWLRDQGRTEYTYATDDAALEGVKLLSRLEGIIPALESAHAVAHLVTLAPQMGKDEVILVNLSGRGDKDLGTIMKELGTL